MQEMSGDFGRFLVIGFEFLAGLLLIAIGAIVLWALSAYIIDVTQTKQAIRRNYPVIGRFRYFFEHLGEFFRQYFFAMDREELPFNRAQRSWVYRAAKNLNNTIAFGSTRDLQKTGNVLFVCTPFPTPGEDAVPVTSARGFMFALGCIQALQCNRNTCPTGITIHNEKLQRGLNPEEKAERVANYCTNMVQEVGMIAHACGVRSRRELTRTHARVVQENGLSMPLDRLHPTPLARG